MHCLYSRCVCGLRIPVVRILCICRLRGLWSPVVHFCVCVCRMCGLWIPVVDFVCFVFAWLVDYICAFFALVPAQVPKPTYLEP